MAEILPIDPSNPEPERIARAAELLRQSQVVAIPTDTFYGLAANPFDLAAVETIFSIKGRFRGNPLLLLVDSVETAAGLAIDPPAQFYKLARRFWPGPLTVVLTATRKLTAAVTAQTGRIGLRLPAAAIPVALVRATGFAITATSANLTGERECSSAQEVQDCLGDRLPLILDGGVSQLHKPSTILDLKGESWRILREGAVSREELTAFFSAETLPGKRTSR